jgi:autotransporter-associated beta strand protein
MNKRIITAALLLAGSSMAGFAQRQFDKLDRGLIAVKQTSGMYCSWRINADEYYGTTYNLYRDGVKVNDEPLSVSNYTDPNGTIESQYTVKAVHAGKESEASKTGYNLSNNWLEVKKPTRISNDGTTDISNSYEPNDATIGDVDGDGEMELITKQINTNQDPNNTSQKDFARIEVQKLDGTLLWWIDCGPNMWDFQQNEINIMAYDWDQDGVAECVARLQDNSIIHLADGTTYTVGDATKDYRGSVYEFLCKGDEYLVYMDGKTGKPYTVQEFPLKRLESDESDLAAAWGDGYGHRAMKFFFGAPYLDGRKPSIFLARGIYTRHKMAALDVDPATHNLTVRWRWNCSNGSSAWYGQGYHNYSIADVDQDGRDEIVFGSMVIDDNGKGLSTCGLGHGDAHHVGQFDPYREGLQVFCCNESQPANNYRDATTSKILYRMAGGSDDGRSMFANFTNLVPGAIGSSAHDQAISAVTCKHAENLPSGYWYGNVFRIYWDGDLLDEDNDATSIHKFEDQSIITLTGALSNNSTKATPCLQADIFGDWREEIVARTASGNMRIYTTNIPTKYRMATLLSDKQYRNAMQTQMNGYNQPPHVSFFVGELEGITQAPPPETTNGKTEVTNGGTIATDLNGKQVIMAETGDMTATVAEGAQPEVFFDVAPSWTQGHDNNNNITTSYYTHTLTGAAFTGDTRVTKQGKGTLVMPAVVQTYTGATDVWGGTVRFDGTMQQSHVWLNRFASLQSDGGSFQAGVSMDYGAKLMPGAANHVGTVTIDSLALGFGARVVFDIDDNTKTTDVLKVSKLSLEKKDWSQGPQYSAPVFQIAPSYLSGKDRLEAGTYVLAEVGELTGDLANVTIDGINNQKASLAYADGKITITIADQRDAAAVEWQGDVDSNWDLLTTENFTVSGLKDKFVSGDQVTFGDNATRGDITVAQPVTVSALTFTNDSLAYTISGDSIVGTADLTKTGAGDVTISNVNRFVGTTRISGGILNVASLANTDGQEYGALGGISNRIELSGNAVLGITASTACNQIIRVASDDAAINVANGAYFTMKTGFVSTNGRHTLTKSGAGTMSLNTNSSLSTISMAGGTLDLCDGANADTLRYTTSGSKVYDSNSMGSYSTNSMVIVVPEKVSGNFWMDPRCDYKGKLLGAGSFYIYAAGNRNYLSGDWSAFEGTVIAGQEKRSTYDPVFDWNNSYGLPKATLQVASGTTVQMGSKSMSLGHVKGEGAINGTGTLTIGALNEEMLKGTTLQITGAKVRKVGSGIWNLSTTSAQASIGEVTIAGGELRLDDSNFKTLLTGTSLVSVTDSGLVQGRGKLQVITVNGGTLAPGTYYGNHYGSIRTAGNVTISKGRLELTITNNRNNATSRSYLEVGGTLTVNDSVIVKLSNRYTPAVGDSIVLWTANKFAGKPKVSLPTLPATMMWDDSELCAANGVLKIAANTGIYGVNADGTTRRLIFTLDGRRTNDDLDQLPAGVYVVKENGRTYKVNKR